MNIHERKMTAGRSSCNQWTLWLCLGTFQLQNFQIETPPFLGGVVNPAFNSEHLQTVWMLPLFSDVQWMFNRISTVALVRGSRKNEERPIFSRCDKWWPNVAPFASFSEHLSCHQIHFISPHARTF